MKKYFLFIALTVLVSCKEVRLEDNVYFEEAQPINDSELTKIPSKFIGRYFYNDSMMLSINDGIIAYQNNFRVRIHKTELDSLKNDLVYTNGTFIEKKTNTVLEHKFIGDSIELVLKDVDTLFTFSKDQKAKKSNGKLILSTKDSIYWQIKILTLDKNIITIQELYASTDIQAIDSLTRIKSKKLDATNYVVKPSGKEFTKILKLKRLGSTTSYKKVK